MGKFLSKHIEKFAMLKHQKIPYVEFQVVEINENKISLQDIYSGKINIIDTDDLSSDYYYLYTSKYKRYNKWVLIFM